MPATVAPKIIVTAKQLSEASWGNAPFRLCDRHTETRSARFRETSRGCPGHHSMIGQKAKHARRLYGTYLTSQAAATNVARHAEFYISLR